MSEFWRVITHAFFSNRNMAHQGLRVVDVTLAGTKLGEKSSGSEPDTKRRRVQGKGYVLRAQGLNGNIGAGSSVGWRWAWRRTLHLLTDCRESASDHTSQPIPACRVGWSRVQGQATGGGSESEQTGVQILGSAYR